MAACADLWTDTGGSFDAYATGRLDPSGYVKGSATQIASDMLDEVGCPDHCVNAGEDIRLRGNPVPGRRWQLGIRNAWQAEKLCLAIEGTNLGVATYGVYGRGLHIVNPIWAHPRQVCAPSP